jgi:hypothetical protein
LHGELQAARPPAFHRYLGRRFLRPIQNLRRQQLVAGFPARGLVAAFAVTRNETGGKQHVIFDAGKRALRCRLAGGTFNQYLRLHTIRIRDKRDTPNSAFRIYRLHPPFPPVSENLLEGAHHAKLLLDPVFQVLEKYDVIRQQRMNQADPRALLVEADRDSLFREGDSPGVVSNHPNAHGGENTFTAASLQNVHELLRKSG